MNPQMSKQNVAKVDTVNPDTNTLLERTMNQTKWMGFRAARATVSPFLRITQFSSAVVSVTLLNIAHLVESIGTQVANIDAWLYADITNTQVGKGNHAAMASEYDGGQQQRQEEHFLNASEIMGEYGPLQKERERKKQVTEDAATEGDLKSS